MNISYENRRENNAIVLQLKGDLIGDEVGPELVDVVSDAINDNIKNCIVDLKNVRYLPSELTN